VVLAPAASVNGFNIGSKLFDKVEWKEADPAIKSIALLILISAKSSGMIPDWIHASLFHPSIGVALTQRTPFLSPFPLHRLIPFFFLSI
jgi:hypothetical protein